MRLLPVLLFFLLFSTECFATHQWEQKADFGNFGRHRAIGIGIGNKAYVGMGHLNGTGIDSWYADWWEYDPATNAWTQRADYIGNSGNGDQDIVAVGFDNVGFVGLGQIDGNGFYKYDPQLNQWSVVTSPPATFDFNNLQAFSIANKGYFLALFSTRFFEYDADLDQWTELSNLPFSSYWGDPTFSIGNKGYVKDGANFWEYDPVTNGWTAKAPFPGSTPQRPKGFSHNGHGFLVGGMMSWVWSREVWSYNPTNDTWTQQEDFPGTTRRWAVVMSVGERVYYGLGTNGTNFNDFWEFNSIAGVDEFNLEGFSAYPTLANDFVNFSSKDHQEFQITVYSTSGKKVQTLKTSDGTIQLNRGSIASGYYIYHVIIDDAVVHSDRFVFR